ncbi:MAG: hypothetical protein ACRDZ4_17545, partial [Egibacteraceae bacterium]
MLGLPWWVMPAVTFGITQFIKAKGKDTFAWLRKTEEEAKAMPVLLAVGQAESGPQLPDAPEGYRWKQIALAYSVSPFSAPGEAKLWVLEKWLNDAQPLQKGAGAMHDLQAFQWNGETNPGAGSFLTADLIGDLGRHRGGRRGGGWRGGRGWGWGPGWWGPPMYYEQPVILVEDPGLTAEALRLKKKEEDEEAKKKAEKKANPALAAFLTQQAMQVSPRMAAWSPDDDVRLDGVDAVDIALRAVSDKARTIARKPRPVPPPPSAAPQGGLVTRWDRPAPAKAAPKPSHILPVDEGETGTFKAALRRWPLDTYSAKLDGFMGAVSGAAQQALKQVAAELAATGRVLTPLDPVAAR